jgi:hypothetical protein
MKPKVLGAMGIIVLAMGLSPDTVEAQKVRESPHKKLTLACDACHVATSFNDIRFDHTATGFALEGQHAVAKCLSCHNIEDFSRVDRACASCHQDVHSGRSGATCEHCHTAGGWRVFDAEEIHADTNFPVMGRHLVLDCESCHPGMPETDFRNTSSDCYTCHRADYEGVASPDHKGSGFSTDCRECHQLLAWTPAVMGDHDAVFPIFSGMHRNQWSDCSECHTSQGNYRVFDCLTCHEHAQDNTDIHHAGMPGYAYTSNECLACHPTGAADRYTQHDPLYFPIYSGTHTGQWTDCASCHTTSTATFSCIDCHQHEPVATDSHHNGMPGYSYTSEACYFCHPTGVKGNFVEHDTQYFPIFSGTHSGQWTDCAACHTTGGAAFSCIDCHAHDQPTVEVKHNGMPGYAYASQSCFGCHPTGVAGRFTDHDALFFPVYSGKHSGRWTDCAECHTSAGNNAVFSCLDCHLQNDTDPHHVGMPGYSYTSAACLDCHPDGNAGQFTIHDAQYFPIYSGTHTAQWTDCAACHTTSSGAFSCVDCHAHDPASTDPTHNGMTGYAYDSQACFGCHPTGVGGQFVDHDAQFFPIYTGKHAGRWNSCAQCHVTPGNNSVFSCFECHEHSQSRMDDKHLGEVNGYSYDSIECLRCHPDGRSD